MRPILLLAMLSVGSVAHAQKLSPSADLDHPFMVVKKKGQVLDFKGATLWGTPDSTDPDKRKGLAILVTADDVTIKNLHVRGYMIGILAQKCKNLKLVNVDGSYNWKQHLGSDLEKEDQNDWLFFHHNEKHEWFRYGASFYLDEVNGYEVKGCKATGGQCALMLNRSNQGVIWNNDFSFMSGLGLGMYRSSDNRIMHNRFDFCVRGYSHGVYNRGQDSSGILIYEQSHRNVFAYNSATHGGDGFFLWAGQETMDTGKGGCNDNLVYGNDFSDSPANGIEATFSRNNFINNLCNRCWHAVWGGYSYDTRIEGNVFENNEESIAIEHGQNISIKDNEMRGNKLDLNLWANKNEDPNWGYPKHRDTDSQNFSILGNVITAPSIVRQTKNSRIMANRFDFLQKPPFTSLEGSTKLTIKGNNFNFKKQELPDGQTDQNTWYDGPMQTVSRFWTPTVKYTLLNTKDLSPGTSDWAELEPKPMQNGANVFTTLGDGGQEQFKGRQYILVDEWGPFDYRSPRIWPKPVRFAPDKMAGTQMEVIGPKGQWRVISHSPGIKVVPESGTVPAKIHVLSLERFSGTQQIEMEFIGDESVDVKGVKHPLGKPVRFSYEKTKIPIEWDVKWWAWDAQTQDPRTQYEAFEKVVKGEPLASDKMLELAGNWYGSPHKGVPENHFATLAEGEFDCAEGDYDVEITSDDGCRLYLDGKKLVDEWHYQGPTTYHKQVHLKGHHKFEVQHFEIDGFSCLKVKLNPVKKR